MGDDARVPVVRLKIGEVCAASSVVVLPVCRSEEKRKRFLKGHRSLGVRESLVWWWQIRDGKDGSTFPGWEPVLGLENGVVVSFEDARALPWKVNRWYKEEAILVVTDRRRKEVTADDGFYLVATDDGELKVERGEEESLGTVYVVG